MNVAKLQQIDGLKGQNMPLVILWYFIKREMLELILVIFGVILRWHGTLFFIKKKKKLQLDFSPIFIKIHRVPCQYNRIQ